MNIPLQETMHGKEMTAMPNCSKNQKEFKRIIEYYGRPKAINE